MESGRRHKQFHALIRENGRRMARINLANSFFDDCKIFLFYGLRVGLRGKNAGGRNFELLTANKCFLSDEFRWVHTGDAAFLITSCFKPGFRLLFSSGPRFHAGSFPTNFSFRNLCCIPVEIFCPKVHSKKKQFWDFTTAHFVVGSYAKKHVYLLPAHKPPINSHTLLLWLSKKIGIEIRRIWLSRKNTSHLLDLKFSLLWTQIL